jgi:cytochrome c oxidase subunit II
MRGYATCAGVAAALTLSACSPVQSVLTPEGDTARSIFSLFWFFTIVCAAIWVIVMVLLLVATVRRRAAMPDPVIEPDPARERRIGWIVGGGTAATVIVLTVFTLASFLTNKGFAEPRPHGLTIKVTGHQWWWQVNYEAHSPDQTFETANEIHIPVGQPVQVKLISADVIHSFWVPALSGKTDTIPGQTNETWLEARRPGRYRGQCTEFCGWQHAHMPLFVVAEPQAAFQAWWDAQLRPAPEPSAPPLAKAEETFVYHCGTCHAVRGTLAGGSVAPDLTHLMSRDTIAAGALPNTIGNLSGWIADPQAIKPGTRMPNLYLSGPELQNIRTYLATLE